MPASERPAMCPTARSRPDRRSLWRRAPLWLLVMIVFGSGVALGQADPAYKLRAARFLAGRNGARGASANALVKARVQHGAMRSAFVAADQTSLGANWQPVGPARVMTAAYGAITGRVTAVALDPGDATGNTVYLGTTGGGVWKSVNAAGPASAVSFVPLTDTLSVFDLDTGSAATPSLSIGAVAVQPGVHNGVVLAGTGDPNDALDSYYGGGLLRSADGGLTWTLIGQSYDGVAGNHSFKGLGVAGFAWSTASPGVVVAGLTSATWWARLILSTASADFIIRLMRA